MKVSETKFMHDIDLNLEILKYTNFITRQGTKSIWTKANCLVWDRNHYHFIPE